MRAAFITQPGPPDCIQVGEIPDPHCDDSHVLVRVRAASVNPIDTYIRNGANYWPLPNPFVIGCDFAGEIVRVGKHASHLHEGQRVWGSNQGLMGRQGTFAQYAAIEPRWIYPSPDSVNDRDLAATALVGITAHLGLFHRAKLQPGETVFVRGGTGGVGAMVVQMAKAVGARVITTAGSPEKADRCRQLGADEVIEYRTTETKEALARFSPHGVDVFWETLREPDFELAVAGLAPNGRMVLMAGRDARPPFPVGPFYVKGCSLLGFAMFAVAAEIQQQAAMDINHWIDSGKLRAQIDRVLPLGESAEAHRLQESNTVAKSGILQGKLVIDID
ncbi:MAG: NADPH:quinone reductase [Pirellula sp.]|jgi:NADPH2:quinone reductase|nr:NADPH:quinone reductase [Pirellula sp.]